MPWVRFDDLFTEHPKIAEVGGFGIALQVAAVAYCNRNLTDGFVPRSVVPGLVSWERIDGAGVVWTGARTSGMQGEDLDNFWIAAQLVAAGIWHDAATIQQCPRCAERWPAGQRQGYYIHDYLEYQASREEVLRQRDALRREREATRNRVQRFRLRHATSADVTPDVTPGVTPDVTPDVTPTSHDVTPISQSHTHTQKEVTLYLDDISCGSKDNLYGVVTCAPSDSTNRSAPPPASLKPQPDAQSRHKPPQVAWDERAGFTVSDELLARWDEAYPAVEVRHEIRKAHEWVMADYPRRRKVRWQRFLVNWLARAQDRGGSRRGREETLEERMARHVRDLRAMRAAGRLPPEGGGKERGPPVSALPGVH